MSCVLRIATAKSSNVCDETKTRNVARYDDAARNNGRKKRLRRVGVAYSRTAEPTFGRLSLCFSAKALPSSSIIAAILSMVRSLGRKAWRAR